MGRFYKGTEDQFKADVLREIRNAFAQNERFVFADFEDVTLPDNNTVECLTILSPGEGYFYTPALDLYSTIIKDFDASVSDWAKSYVGQHPSFEYLDTIDMDMESIEMER